MKSLSETAQSIPVKHLPSERTLLDKVHYEWCPSCKKVAPYESPGGTVCALCFWDLDDVKELPRTMKDAYEKAKAKALTVKHNSK